VSQARKRQTRGRRPASTGSNGLIHFAAGLLIGLMVAVLVYLHDNGRIGGGMRTLIDGARRAAQSPPVKPAAEPPLKAAQGKPAAPKFDFYTVLPEIESVLPETAVDEAARRDSATAGVPARRYVLQAASYANFTDADRLKAELALKGIEAYIEKVTIGERGDYYRVRLGPYARLEELDRVNRKLTAAGVRAIRIQVHAAGD